MEKNFKWGPWKKGGIDSSYGPFAIQEYEREGTKDVGEFKDIPAYQSRFDVVDEQSGHHEFDSRSDAMKYAEKSFKEWKKMQKTKKNSIEQKKLAVIKSNAAPEVKLKALEILSNGTLEDYHKMTKAYQTGDKKTALEIAQKLAQSGWKDSARMKDVEHVLKQLSNGYDNADSKLNGAEADKVSQMAKEVESVREEMGKIVTKFALTLDRDDIDPKLAQKIKTAMGSALGKLAEANLGSKELAQKYKGAQR